MPSKLESTILTTAQFEDPQAYNHFCKQSLYLRESLDYPLAIL